MSEAPFARKTLRWLVAICVVSFVGALLISLFGPELEHVPSTGSDSYSPSATGHQAFIRILRKLDIPVVASRHDSAARAGRGSVLVLAEPRNCPGGSRRAKALGDMLDAGAGVLLVLPKWEGKPSKEKRGWVESVDLLPASEITQVLAAAGMPTHILRHQGTDALRWQTGPFGHDPSLPSPTAQLLPTRDVQALIACDEGVLLADATRGRHRLLVLSDPDILSNAGIGKGANGALVVSIIEHLRDGDGAVVVDETIHGHERAPSIWRELLSFPLVVLMAQALVVLAILLWLATGRFGAPQRPPPTLEPGHRFLIENTAELLRYRGQLGAVLPPYFRSTVQSVRRTLGAPTDLDGSALEAWLDRVAAARGATDRLGVLEKLSRQVEAHPGRTSRVLGAAARIDRWRREILHGPGSHTQSS